MGPRVQATTAFARNLSKMTSLPILYQDERLSTAAVTRTLLEADTSRARRAEVVDVSRLSGDQIKFGATVTLADEDTDEKITYQIVGADESDIRSGLLSIQSPLARALIGKAKGDSVEVVTPGGARAYEILAVAYR